jgi:negative regulator of sigma E activity
VDAAERLAAYLAGELDADERTALEAALARDAELRRELAAIRRADAALGALTSPTPPPGFEERLHAALAAELTAQLGTARPSPAARASEQAATGGHPAGGSSTWDELAARRKQRQRPRWIPVLGGVAASLVLLATGIAVVNLGAGDDAGSDMAVTMEASDDAGGLEEGAADLGGPVVLDEGRTIDADDADALLAGPALADVTDRQLPPAEGAAVADQWAAQLGAPGERALESLPAPEERAAEDVEEEAAEDADVATDGAAPETDLDAATGPVDDDEALTRCLAELLDGLDGAEPAIPAYVEFVTYDGRPAIVYGLVTVEPSTGAYTRSEVWIVDRADCQVVRFAQG